MLHCCFLTHSFFKAKLLIFSFFVCYRIGSGFHMWNACYSFCSEMLNSNLIRRKRVVIPDRVSLYRSQSLSRLLLLYNRRVRCGM